MSSSSPNPGQAPLVPERVLSVRVLAPQSSETAPDPKETLAQALGLDPIIALGPSPFTAAGTVHHRRVALAGSSAIRCAVSKGAYLVSASAHERVQALLAYAEAKPTLLEIPCAQLGVARLQVWAGSGPAPGQPVSFIVRLPLEAFPNARHELLTLSFIEQARVVSAAVLESRRVKTVLDCRPLFLEIAGAVTFVGLHLTCLPHPSRSPSGPVRSDPRQDPAATFRIRFPLTHDGVPAQVATVAAACFPQSSVLSPKVNDRVKLTWERLELDLGLDKVLDDSKALLATFKAAVLDSSPRPAPTAAASDFVAALVRAGAAQQLASRRQGRAPAPTPGLPPRPPLSGSRGASPSPSGSRVRTLSQVDGVHEADPLPNKVAKNDALSARPSREPTPDPEQHPPVRAPSPALSDDAREVHELVDSLLEGAQVPTRPPSRAPSPAPSLPPTAPAAPVANPAPFSAAVRTAIAHGRRGGRLLAAAHAAAAAGPSSSSPALLTAEAAAALALGHGHGHAQDQGGTASGGVSR